MQIEDNENVGYRSHRLHQKGIASHNSLMRNFAYPVHLCAGKACIKYILQLVFGLSLDNKN